MTETEVPTQNLLEIRKVLGKKFNYPYLYSPRKYLQHLWILFQLKFFSKCCCCCCGHVTYSWPTTIRGAWRTASSRTDRSSYWVDSWPTLTASSSCCSSGYSNYSSRHVTVTSHSRQHLYCLTAVLANLWADETQTVVLSRWAYTVRFDSR